MNIRDVTITESSVIKTRAFLTSNTRLLLNLMGIPPSRSKVMMKSFLPIHKVWVDVRNPSKKAVPQSASHSRFVEIWFNAVIFGKCAGDPEVSPFDITIFLWEAIGRALRLYCILDNKISPNDLLPLRVSKKLAMEEIPSAIIDQYVTEDLSPPDVRREIDTSIIAGYVAMRAALEEENGGTFDPRSVVPAIAETTRRNWKRMLMIP